MDREIYLMLWRCLSRSHRMKLLSLLVLMIVVSCSEVLSVGAIFPFLALLADPEKVMKYGFVRAAAGAFGVTTAQDLLAPLAIVFAAAAIFAGAMRVLLLWASNHFAFSLGSDLSVDVYDRILGLPYSRHIASKSSELINTVSYKTGLVIDGILMPALLLMSAVFMAAVISLAMFYVSPLATLLSVTGFGLLYVLAFIVSKKRLKKCGREISSQKALVVKAVQEGLGGIRDVILDGTHGEYVECYRQADKKLRDAQGRYAFLSQSPRFAMESLGMALIALLALVLARGHGGIAAVVPTLGALALGAQRLLPVLHQAYYAVSAMQSAAASSRETLDFLSEERTCAAPRAKVTPLPFTQSIVFRDVEFKYANDAPSVLSDINLEIRKGARIGFVGKTGSGKSTLMDILMGLLEPSRGIIQVDGVGVCQENHQRWRANIAHVPQDIYLSDQSVMENIAFGVRRGEINVDEVRRAARLAQISDLIDGWPLAYDTPVGERGIRLSGGQRQRLGIARALYKKASVIVLDEATSALDSETEEAVIKGIESLDPDITIIAIAHRTSTLAGCTKIFELDGGRIMFVGGYGDMRHAESEVSRV
ncbi:MULTISPECIES: ABC transporter ATP-binding protein [Paraburkholderia]|uniref:ABC transporter ATP-binding protein n=1 Tax=Paraburkholderia dioscoreae TaxID=2604047 RepID=A0A5Q4Z3R6_9BURK|nr:MULTISPECIES: ABC transporter ATP-binding protein [Paraburkholderia]MDR8396446.1 ABC transporter ATP-binding protein/permease [Paraburkholderia sp. USG1]VVD34186.1 ABC transporter ATP-binding protein [Paraburkholderia dioscoreae]